MLALYIILGVILVVVIILHFPIVASVDLNKENAQFKVKFMFFSIYPLKDKKPKKMSKRKRKKLEKELKKEKQAYKKSLEKAKSSQKQNSQNKKVDEKKEQEKTKESKKSDNSNDKDKKLKDKFNKYKEKWKKIKPYIPLGLKVVKKLIKAIKIRQLEVYILVSDEDAYECAMKYGKISAGVYDTLALIKHFFTVSIKHIAVDCKFNSTESDYKLKCKVKVLPSTLILIALFILVSYIHTNVKLRHNKNI